MMMKRVKNVISLLAIISFLFAACKGKENSETRDIQLLTDSTAYLNNSFGDTSKLAGSDENSPKGEMSESRPHSNSGNRNPDASVSGNANQSNSGASGSNGSNQQANEKKGWSKAAQGAVIGGAAGAVGGAIISKKKGKGAVIGAAVGAAGGYIIGRDKDKKDGRVKQK